MIDFIFRHIVFILVSVAGIIILFIEFIRGFHKRKKDE
jgi:hypothetical protein